jgi:hypothetical protein
MKKAPTTLKLDCNCLLGYNDIMILCVIDFIFDICHKNKSIVAALSDRVIYY